MAYRAVGAAALAPLADLVQEQTLLEATLVAPTSVVAGGRFREAIAEIGPAAVLGLVAAAECGIAFAGSEFVAA
jgi:hypothetical protein